MKDKLRSIQDNKYLLEKKIQEYENKLQRKISNKSDHKLNAHLVQKSQSKEKRTNPSYIKPNYPVEDGSKSGRKAFQ